MFNKDQEPTTASEEPPKKSSHKSNSSNDQLEVIRKVENIADMLPAKNQVIPHQKSDKIKTKIRIKLLL